MYIENRFREIEDALRPLLKVLRLVPVRDEYGPYHRISFHRPGEGDWRSPVMIMFPNEYQTQKAEAEWEDAYGGIQDFSVYDIGTNGWQAYRSHGIAHGPILGGKDAVLNRTATDLRDYDLRPFAKEVPFVIDNSYLIEGWEKLNQSIYNFGVTEMECARDETGESLTFEYAGHEFVLAYPEDGNKVILTVDGELAGDPLKRDQNAIRMLLVSTFMDIDRRSRPTI
ncbi:MULTISPECIES: hypothetical protein [Hyphomicrobiales]|jgi:hypothetical protein|uniref:hypothetical protein n=1 Tax=Hyphomicrobiales TaxID=356 RepID=UPI0006489A8B|nr:MULTISPECIES: hypothetical protein [Hyphomicrobiales]RKD74104.1 hypothetical protein BJ928_101453 [Rhizobium sp. WW_1]RZS83900.1 hypothetical protein EV217_2651 [Phyllobacterium myrsinacearum]